jgi:hypothetical protein
VSAAAERRVRLLLAAYPWRVRAEQGDEIVGTVLDALPPGARRLPVRTAIDLVRGGFRVRVRRRPPWPTVLAYRLGLRIDARWTGWVFDDVEHPHYVRNRRIRAGLAWLLVMGPMAWAFGDPMVVLYGSGGLVGGMAGIARERERRRARHGLVPGGSDPTRVWVQQRRRALFPDVAVAPLLLALGLPPALGGAACIVAVTAPHVRVDTVLGATIHAAAPADVSSFLRPFVAVGIVLAMLLLAGLAPWRVAGASGRGSGPVVRGGRVAPAVAAGLGVGLALAATALALVLRWRWVHWGYAAVAAVVVPVGLALVAVGVAVGVVGRRRGAPVGTWELAPALAPQRRGYSVARWVAETTPGIEPWAPEEDVHRGE